MSDEHNPDTNPHWTPKHGRRIYACNECGTEKAISTNHTGTVWAEPCAGTCRDIFHANTEREVVAWHPSRPHHYVREAGESPVPRLLGEIAEKGGMICLQNVRGNAWYPLEGNSGIAADFQESFNAPQPSDIGRRLYYVGDVMQMESMEQAAERRAREETK